MNNGIITATGISFQYSDTYGPIVDDVTFSCPRGWTGIVGGNGIGKSTLMKIVSGRLRPGTGSILPLGLVERAEYCDQDVPAPPAALYDLLSRTDVDALRMIEQLNIGYDWPYRWDTLSAGEQKRAQIGGALGLNPPVLCVDEPDNHLDATAVDLIVAALIDFEGIGIIVSHNRDLLDRLCVQTIVIRGPEAIRRRPGGVTAALTEEKREDETARRQRDVLIREHRRLNREAQRRHQEADRQDTRCSKKRLDRHDSDGRARIGLAIFTGKDGQAGRLKNRIDDRLIRVEKELTDAPKVGKRKLGITIPTESVGADRLVSLDSTSLGLGSDRSLVIPEIVVRPGDRIGLIGENGSGKSTLIRRLVRTLDQRELRFSWYYLPQTLSSSDREKLQNAIFNCNTDTRAALLSELSRLDSDPARILATEAPSPGEARKVATAFASIEKRALLILDEPTNHLDLSSILEIESALRSYSGAIIIATHDRRFLAAVCDRIWSIEQTDDPTRNRLRIA